MTHQRPHIRGSAFTLFELIVVINLFALMIGIVAPSLSNARRSAREVGCLKRVHSISRADFMYAADNDDKLAVQRWTDVDGTSFGGNAGISIDEVLSGYLGRHISREEAIAVTWAEGTDRAIWSCPQENLPRANPDSTVQRRSYGLNMGYNPELRETPNVWRDRWTGPVMSDDNWSGGLSGLYQGRLAEVKPECVILGDAASYWGYIAYPGSNGFSMSIAMSPTDGYVRGFGAPGWPQGPSQFYAHETKLIPDPMPNMAFADGSAGPIDVVALAWTWGYEAPYNGGLNTRGTIFDAFY